MKLNTTFAVQQTMQLLNIPSPTGYTMHVTQYLLDTLTNMGFKPVRNRKGSVCCTLGGEGRPLALAAHVDTLGLMVRTIKGNGNLMFTRLGGPAYQAVETENVTVITREGKQFSGVIQLRNASTHVNHDMDDSKRNDSTMEVLLDENVSSKADVEALGISAGDFICLDPRARVTESGYIRSRFLDDKLSAGMLLALAKGVADGEIKLARKTTIFFSVYEEVGHGASTGLPQDTEDLLVVDMGCVGDDINCTEMQVSICAKDSGGPYDYTMTSELIAISKEKGIDYAVDIYPYYGSDAGTALRSGMDIRYALIGAGVYASHGYERSHVKGVENTLKLIEAYVQK